MSAKSTAAAKPKERINFGKLTEVIPPPNLIRNQLDSFKEYLQLDTPPTQRKSK